MYPVHQTVMYQPSIQQYMHDCPGRMHGLYTCITFSALNTQLK